MILRLQCIKCQKFFSIRIADYAPKEVIKLAEEKIIEAVKHCNHDLENNAPVA